MEGIKIFQFDFLPGIILTRPVSFSTSGGSWQYFLTSGFAIFENKLLQFSSDIGLQT
jgi:hypothetical protein